MPEFMNISFPPQEQARFRAWLDRLDRETSSQVKTLIKTTSYDIEHRAKREARVDTGYLRSSINVAFSNNGFGASVFTHRKYAPYVEWGTGNLVSVDKNIAPYALTFKGKGLRKVNRRAYPYLFPAFRIETAKMKNKLKQMGFHERPL